MTGTPTPQHESAAEFLKRLRALASDGEGDDNDLSEVVDANRLPHDGLDFGKEPV